MRGVHRRENKGKRSVTLHGSEVIFKLDLFTHGGFDLNTEKIDAIVQAGLDQLERFYGADDESMKRAKKKKCGRNGCYETVRQGVAFCPLHRKSNIPFLIGKNDPNKFRSITTPPKEPVRVAPVEPVRVILRGLSARQIIDRVKELTGETITICVKSKANVIRHAKIIFGKKNIDVSI